MNDNRRRKQRDKKKGQDVAGLLLSFVGGLFSVTLFLSLFSGPPKLTTFTAPVIGVTDVLGAVPGLVLCLMLTVLGTLLFLQSKELPLGRHVAGILGTSLGLAVALGDGGGSLGSVIPSALAGRTGDVLALALGLILLLASIWVTWLGNLPALARKPKGASSVLPPKVEVPQGVSAAEAAALASDPTEVRSLPAARPVSPAADVRRQGGVPEGAKPLESDEHDTSSSAAANADRAEGAHPTGDRQRADGPLPFPAPHAAGADLAPEGRGASDAAGAPAAELSPGPRSFEAEVKPLSPEDGSIGGSPLRPSWESAYEDAKAEAEALPLAEEPPVEPVAQEQDTRSAQPSIEVEKVDPAVGEAEEWEEDDEGEEEDDEDQADEVSAGGDDEEKEDDEEEDDEDEADEVSAGGDDEEEEDDEEEDDEDEADEVSAEGDDEEGDDDDDDEEDEDEDEVSAADDEEGEEDEESEELVAAGDEEEEAEADGEETLPPSRQPGLFDVDEPRPAAAAEGEAPDDEEADEEEDEEQELVAEVDATEEEDEAPDEEDAAYVLQPQEAAAARSVVQPDGDEREQLVHAAGCLILEQNRVAVSMLERSFEMDFDQACEILDELQDRGLIGPYKGGRTRDILLSRDEWLTKAP